MGWVSGPCSFHLLWGVLGVRVLLPLLASSTGRWGYRAWKLLGKGPLPGCGSLTPGVGPLHRMLALLELYMYRMFLVRRGRRVQLRLAARATH